MSIMANNIIDTVARVRRVPRADLLGEGRTVLVVRARHEMFSAVRQLTNLSVADVGRICGNKDHGTVLHALRRIEETRDSDAEFRESNDRLMNELRDLDPLKRLPSGAEGSPLALAHRAVALPGELGLSEIQSLGMALLMISSVGRADHLSDDEARLATASILTMGASEIGGHAHG